MNIMEKLNKKIENSNNNPSLLHQVFNELELQIVNKLTEQDVGKLPELRYLWDLCGHSSYSVAYEACQSVTNLSFKGHLGIDESITALLTNISTARHYGPLTDSVAFLMLRGPSLGGRHPFISLYELQADSWPYIAQQTSNIISSGVFEVQALKDIKPFVIYILCYGSYETQISLLCLLMEKLYNEKSSCQILIDWLLEALSWNHIQKTSKDNTNFFLICAQHLSQYAIAQKNEKLGRVMAIFLMLAMQESHKKLECGIQHSVFLLKQLNENFVLHLEPVIVMLAQFLLECQANCYEPILDLCLLLTKKSCNTYVWTMLQYAVLSIFSYSSKIESSVVKIVESVVVSSQPKRFDCPTSVKDYNMRQFARSGSIIQEAIATADLADHLEKNICGVKFGEFTCPKPTPFPTTVFLLKCAMFWRLDDLSALEDAVTYVSTTKQHASSLLTLLLKKLTAPSNGKTKLAILYYLPALAIDKTCVPRILQILEALSSSQQLKPVRLRLLTDLWSAEDRVYPFLDKALSTETIETEEFLVAKATAIEIICSKRSDKYGAELLSVISELLNSSLAKVNTSCSSIIATLALRSLVSLCRTEVVDLKSVWDLLAPKLNQDRRDSVVSEMCNLLGLAAELKIDTEEYDKFIQQAIKTLFRVSLTNHSTEVRCLALRSLSRFSKKDFHLKCMPDVCKDDIKIPSKYLQPGKTEIAVKPEDVLDYVPGACWMKLLDFYDGELLPTGFVSLISQLIRKEIENMPIWVYRKAATDVTKHNEPANYATFLKEDSVLAALVVYVQRICDINQGTHLRMSMALRVLAGPYQRPLPPLNWTILLPIAQQHNLESEFMEIVFAQTPHSFSAQSITEDIMKSDPLNGKLALLALSYLGPICKALPFKTVQSFLYQLINHQQSEISVILKRLQDSLSAVDSPVSLEVKETIADVLVGFFPVLPEDLESEKLFANCFRLVSGPHQPLCEPSVSTAKKNILILLYASQQSLSKPALEYLLKALQLTLYLPRLDTDVIELVTRCVDTHCKTSTSFLLQFLSYVQLTAMRSPDKNQIFSSLMDTLALVVGALSDSLIFTNCTSDEDRSEALTKALWKHFSLSLSRLFNQPQWVSSKKNMQDWICAMLEKDLITTDQRQSLLDALPSMGSVEKEIFFRVMASI